MAGKDRRDFRENEKVSIVASGKHLKSHPIEKQAEGIDISSVGISLHPGTSVNPRSFLSIELSKNNIHWNNFSR